MLFRLQRHRYTSGPACGCFFRMSEWYLYGSIFGGWGSKRMRKVLIIVVMALALAGCANGRQDRVLGGALIGGGTGAVIGGLAGRTAGAAFAGGLIGAAAGAIIADVTRPGWCYYWRHHRRHYVRC